MGFQRALRKYFAGITLLLVALAAYFQASGITQLIASALGPNAPSVGQQHSISMASVFADNHATTAHAILEHNPFDSATRHLLEAQDTSAAGAPTVYGEDDENAPPCDGLRALLVLASPERAWSVAALTRDGDTQTRIVRIGDQIDHKVVRVVEWNRVVLSSGSSACQVRMFRATKRNAQPVNAGAHVDSGPVDARALVQTITSRVQKVSANEFNVERGAVNDIVDRQAELMRQIRLVPHMENGRIVGIDLLGVRPDGVFGLLGIENGDRLETINGFDMTSPEGALEAYARLRTADHWTVRVKRRSQEVNVDFNIQ
jgi:general secretion pathway protein C